MSKVKNIFRGGRKIWMVLIAIMLISTISVTLLACDPVNPEPPKTTAEKASEIFEMISQAATNMDPGGYKFGIDVEGSVNFEETSGAWSTVNGKTYSIKAKINLNTDPASQPTSGENEVFFEIRESGAETPLIGVYYSDNTEKERNYIYIQSGNTKKAVEIYSLSRLITGKYQQATEPTAAIDVGAIIMSALSGFFSDASISEARDSAYLELNLEDLFFADGADDKVGIDNGLWGIIAGVIDFKEMGLDLTIDQLINLKPQIKIGITFKFDKDPANGGVLSGAEATFTSARAENITIKTTDGSTLIDYTIPQAKIKLSFDTLAIKAGEKIDIAFPAFDESWEIIELINAKVTGAFGIEYANGDIVQLEYDLIANVDIFDVITNYAQASKLDEDSYFYLQIRHVACDGSCAFCKNRVASVNKAARKDVALLDVAFSPKDFGNTNVYISLAPMGILSPAALATLANMDSGMAGAAGMLLSDWEHNLVSIDLEALFYALNPTGYQTSVSASTENAAFDIAQLPSIVKMILGALDGIEFKDGGLNISVDTIKSLTDGIEIEGMGKVSELIASLLDGKVNVDGKVETVAAKGLRVTAELTLGTTQEERVNAKERITTRLIGGNRQFDFDKDLSSIAGVAFDIDHAITSEGVYSNNYINIVNKEGETLLGGGIEKVSLELLENILRNGYIQYSYTTLDGTVKTGKTKVLGIYGLDKNDKNEQDVMFVTELASGKSLIENLGALGLNLSIPGAVFSSKLTLVDSFRLEVSAENDNPIMQENYKNKISDVFDLKANFNVIIEDQTTAMELTGKIIGGGDSVSVDGTSVTRTGSQPIVVEWNYSGLKITKTVEMIAIETITSTLEDMSVKMGDKLKDWLAANFNDNSKTVSLKYEGVEQSVEYVITSQMIVDIMKNVGCVFMNKDNLTDSNNLFIKEGTYDLYFSLAGEEIKLFTLTIEAPHSLQAQLNNETNLVDVTIGSKGNTAFDKTYYYRVDVRVEKDGEIVPANSYEVLVKGLDEGDHFVTYLVNGVRKYSVLSLKQDATKNFSLEFYGLEGNYDIIIELVYGSSATTFRDIAYACEVKGATIAKKDWAYTESTAEFTWLNEIKANASYFNLFKILYTNKYGEDATLSLGYVGSTQKYRVYKGEFEWEPVIECVDEEGNKVEFFNGTRTSASLTVGKVYTLTISFTDDDGNTFTSTNDITIIA